MLALAATAGIAIENARLYDESQRRQLWLAASAEISGALLSDQADTDPLQLIAETVKRLSDADVATLVTHAEEQGTLEVVVATGLGADQLIGMRYPVKDSVVAVAMETGRGVRIGVYDERQRRYLHLARILDIGPVMSMPMSGRGGPRGALTVGRLKGRTPFATAELEMAEAFASHAAIAMELVEARGSQQRLAVLEDRDRIARDLHDHVIQRLFAVGLQVQSVVAGLEPGVSGSRLERVVEEVDDTIRQIRSSIFALRDTHTGEAGLRSAVIGVVQQAVPALGFDPSVQFSGPVDTVAPVAMIAEVEAVVREGLTNIAKHAHASNAWVDVSAQQGNLTVRISDDGVGLREARRRSGLQNLRRRAERLSGTLDLDERRPRGLVLLWTVSLMVDP